MPGFICYIALVHLPQLPVLALKVATGTSTGWLMLSTSCISFAEACGWGLVGYPILVASSQIRSYKSSALSQSVTPRARRPLRVYKKGALALQLRKCETRRISYVDISSGTPRGWGGGSVSKVCALQT